MNYKIGGNGDTLLFIHGLSDNLQYWKGLTSHLKRYFQVVRVDLRGHGGSELGSEKISIDCYADDLMGLLDKLNIKRVNLIGFSLGGAVALDFTIKYPQLVDSLILMSTFFKVGNIRQSYLKDLKKFLIMVLKSFLISFCL